MAKAQRPSMQTPRPSGRCLLDQVRESTPLLHIPARTEKAYVQWIERFLRFDRDRSSQWPHLRQMGTVEIDRVVTYLVVHPNTSGKASLVKEWKPHIRDWKHGDPTWRRGKGKGIIGAVNYLAWKGLNAMSFLTVNILGDDQNVFPYVTYEEYGQ